MGGLRPRFPYRGMHLDVGRHLGCTVYGTCTGGKADVVREFGATPIDYQREDFARALPE